MPSLGVLTNSRDWVLYKFDHSTNVLYKSDIITVDLGKDITPASATAAVALLVDRFSATLLEQIQAVKGFAQEKKEFIIPGLTSRLQ